MLCSFYIAVSYSFKMSIITLRVAVTLMQTTQGMVSKQISSL